MPRRETYYDVLTEAVNDLADHGYDSAERVAYWLERLRRAAEEMTRSPERLEQMLREALAATYRKLVERGAIFAHHPGVERFTLAKVRPELRAELDRRILAAANLIRLNKEEAVRKTLQRFSGWATSIPIGGTEAVKKRETKENIRKSLAGLPFEERRVLVDQGHKLTASLNDILARDGGAIALVWHSNWRQANYNYREEHKERDGNVYLLRGSWAQEKGFVKPGPAGYYDEVTAVAEEPFCRCTARYVYALRSLPDEMLTKKGREALAEAKERAA